MNRKFNPGQKWTPSRLKARSFRWGRSPDPARVDSIIGGSLSFPGIGAKIREYKARKAWGEVVGPAIQKRAVPDKLIGKTLYCNVSTSPWMTELNYQKLSIMEKLNSKLGAVTITEIVFKHGHVPEVESPPERAKRRARALSAEELRSIDNLVSPIKDTELRNAVKRAIITAKS